MNGEFKKIILEKIEQESISFIYMLYAFIVFIIMVSWSGDALVKDVGNLLLGVCLAKVKGN